MHSTDQFPAGSHRQLPPWPPYVARHDEDDEVIEGAELILPAERTEVSEWIATDDGWAHSRQSAPWRGEERSRTSPHAHTDSQDRVMCDGEVLFGYGRPVSREPRHRPIIALTENALGYHIFISHEAKRMLVRLGLILIAVLMMLLWGDIAQALELFFSIFVL
ncbi:MAG: hypothetical protein ACUVSU_05155 [Aggregatilineaceae bacterium]